MNIENTYQFTKMNEQQSSYRQIMKATSLFGGVQVFQILISIIRSKFVAVLLGPTGMGILGLLVSTTGIIGGLTNLGLGTSAVKDISEANSTGEDEKVSVVIKVMRRLVWITGILGALVTMIFSSFLSELTFGNKDYTIAFIWISVILLFNQLSNANFTLLQGLRKLQYLAKANIYGSVAGLIITVPLYYLLGMKGIVPVIIITSIITYFFSWYFSKKIVIDPVKITRRIMINESKNMVTLGIVISITGLITVIASYILRIYINRTGNTADVGLYTAGFTIISTYVGMIFTAMGTDYYPRLAAVANDISLSAQKINQQAEIALLILSPILIIFLVFIDWAVIILYSSQFLEVTTMIYWAALGMFFKAVSWAIAFLFLAKGASNLYFWNELAGNLYTLGFNILGYHFGGLTGLGISFLLTYLIYLIQVYIIARVKYKFEFSHSFKKIFGIQIIFIMSSFLSVLYMDQPYLYIVGILLIALSGWTCYHELDKRIGIKELISSYFKKDNN